MAIKFSAHEWFRQEVKDWLAKTTVEVDEQDRSSVETLLKDLKSCVVQDTLAGIADRFQGPNVDLTIHTEFLETCIDKETASHLLGELHGVLKKYTVPKSLYRCFWDTITELKLDSLMPDLEVVSEVRTLLPHTRVGDSWPHSRLGFDPERTLKRIQGDGRPRGKERW